MLELYDFDYDNIVIYRMYGYDILQTIYRQIVYKSMLIVLDWGFVAEWHYISSNNHISFSYTIYNLAIECSRKFVW